MLALSPLFPTRWPLEDLFAQNLQQDCLDISREIETNLNHPLVDFDQLHHGFAPHSSFGDLMKVTKKLNHNANERGRRMMMNNLYAFLRSLLSMSSDQKKKVSIPETVSRALKYLPRLQKEVEALTSKKELLLSCSSSTKTILREHQCPKEATIETKSSVVVSVCILDEKEVVIQLISSNVHMKNNTGIGLLSIVLEYLEEEEDGNFLLNATTSKTLGEESFLNTLYLQVQGDHQIEAENLKEKICSLY